jgi:hypothetical protein
MNRISGIMLARKIQSPATLFEAKFAIHKESSSTIGADCPIGYKFEHYGAAEAL